MASPLLHHGRGHDPVYRTLEDARVDPPGEVDMHCSTPSAMSSGNLLVTSARHASWQSKRCGTRSTFSKARSMS